MSTEALAAAGFDLVWPFDARAVAAELGLARLAELPVGLLVGNTRLLWPHFMAARAADPSLAATPHPLDRYTEISIDRIAATMPARVLYAHRRYDGAFLPFQRIAVAAGAGTESPTHLVIHPVYGPWFALRAVLLCDGDPPVVQPRPAAACSCTASCLAAFDRAMAATGPERWRAWLAVREMCPVGRPHRYSDEQIDYHYSFLDRPGE